MAEDRRYRAEWRFADISWRKAKPVAELIRGRGVNEARAILRVTKKRAADMILKVLESAVANALYESQRKGDYIAPDKLQVAECYVNRGPYLKRWRACARGRAHPYRHHSSHIRVVVE